MNYLDLHNKVLDRLREKRVVSTDIDSDPYVRSIGAHINDAKDAVQNAWNWGCNRGEDDVLGVLDESVLTITGSADSNYIYDAILVVEAGKFLKQREPSYMAYRWSNNVSEPIASGHPREFAKYYNADNGDLQVRFNCPMDSAYTYKVFRIKDQADLTEWDDQLKLPSLPVYTLATALASRERGELGGTPTSELFALADNALSDAIAMDSALYPQDTVWFDLDIPLKGNVRTSH